GLPPAAAEVQARADQFTGLVLALRERLRALYAQRLPAEATRALKREQIEQLRAEDLRLRDAEWGGKGEYDDWIAADINNAKLVPFGVYDGWVAAFAALYAQNNRDWTAFFAAAGALARSDAAVRVLALQKLANAAQ